MVCKWIVAQEEENPFYDSKKYGDYINPEPQSCNERFITDGACLATEADRASINPQNMDLEDAALLSLTAWWTDDSKARPTVNIRTACPTPGEERALRYYSSPTINKASPMRKRAMCNRSLGGPRTFNGFPDCGHTDYVKDGFVVVYDYQTINIVFDSIAYSQIIKKQKDSLINAGVEDLSTMNFYFTDPAWQISIKALGPGVTLDHQEKIPIKLQIDFLEINKYDPQKTWISNKYRNWKWNWEYDIPNLANLNKAGISSISCDIKSSCFLTECPLPVGTPTQPYHFENWSYTDGTLKQFNRLS